MEKIVGVTGTPGTGKKSVAAELAPLLKAPLLDLNAVAKQVAPRGRGGYVVDPPLLRRRLKALVPSGAVVFGHLLPDVLRSAEVDFVAVLRCDPSVLRSRLEARGYGAAKVTENLEAELIGVLLDSSLRRFSSGLVHEYDTTSSSPGAVAESIASDVEGGRKQSASWIDWTLDYDSPRRLRSLFSPGRPGGAST